MKIAVPVTNENQVDSHFGHCESYNVFTISDKYELSGMKNIESPLGCGCKSDIAGVLATNGVTILLAGGIGGGAINVFNSCGIKVIRGCTGDSAEVVKQYLSGSIQDSGRSCGSHETHQEGHQCGNN
jgi:predicted Fe-Mo cluster-binding NifX family protein